MDSSQTGSQEVKILLGDFNAKVGSKRMDSLVCDYGLGMRTERG